MTIKQKVHIKGTKDGLIFHLNDECAFEDILDELKNKLGNSHQGILTGPIMRVTIKTGFRKLSINQQDTIKKIFKTKGNLFIYAIENEVDNFKEQLSNRAKVITGVIRSGQVYESDSSILLVGDVNPGGNIISVGDIYIIGTLKGTAHAGSNGNKDAIIVASMMEPAQLRIADHISNFNQEKIEFKAAYDFARVKDNKIVLAKSQHLSKLREAFGTLT